MKIRCFLCSTEYEASSAAVPCPCCHMTHSVRESDIALCRGLYEASKQMQEKRFNKARHMYLALCREYPDSFYPFFGLAAAKYGVSIEKEDGEYIPRCLCPTEESFTDCSAFKKACALADGISAGVLSNRDTEQPLHGTEDKRELLYALGERIECDRANVTKLASLIPSYDIFLSINYEPRSKDYDRTADRLYYRLTEQGGRVFFAPEIIPEADDRQAAPFVYRALETCTQMLVYISDISDIASFRLRNEITRYSALAAAGLKSEDSIVVAYSGIKKEDIPTQLAKYPSFEVKGGGRKSQPLPDSEPPKAQLEQVSEEPENPVENAEPVEGASNASVEINKSIESIESVENAENIENTENIDVPTLETEQEEAPATSEQKSDVLDLGNMLGNAMKRYIKSVSDSFAELSAKLSKNDRESQPKQAEPVEQTEQIEPIEQVEQTEPSEPEISELSQDTAPDTDEVPQIDETVTSDEISQGDEISQSDEVSQSDETSQNDEISQSDEAPQADEQATVEEPNDDAEDRENSEDSENDEPLDVPEPLKDIENDEAVQGSEDSEDSDNGESIDGNIEFSFSNPTIGLGKNKAKKVKEKKPPKPQKPKKVKEKSEPKAPPANTRTTRIVNTICVLVLIGIIGGALVAVHLMGWIFAGTDGLEYQYKNNGYYVTGYSGSKTEVTVPKMYKGNRVVGIAANAFKGSDITSLSIPSSVTDYEKGCLSGILKLETLSLPAPSSGIKDSSDRGYTDVQKSLMGYLFGGDAYSEALPVKQTTLFQTEYSTYIPASLKEITVISGRLESGAFSGMKSLERVTLSDKVSVVEPYAFKGCERLTYADVGNGTICIGDYAFYNCTSLEQLDGGENIYVIGEYAFYGCAKLKSLAVPQKTVSLGSYAFGGCASLESITLPEGLETFGDYAFENCVSLKEIDIPGSVVGIYRGVFSACTSLRTFTGGEGLSGFGAAFFYGCTALSNIAYPFSETFTVIGDSAFQECGSVTKLCDSPYVTTIGGYAYFESGISGDVVIPSNITSIEEKAFALCDGITSVTVPATCALGESAFVGCAGLTRAALGHSIIPERSFMGCEALVSVTLYADDVTLGAYCFDACTALKTVNGAEKISVVGEAAFAQCTSLETIELSNAVQIDKSAFESCKALTVLTVSDKLESIGDLALSGCTGITVFNIPSSVKTVGAYCFADWGYSQTVNIAAGALSAEWQSSWSDLCSASIKYLTD